ncbi:MAG: hypothetical protein ACRD04_01220 [Terriglobales bacterium]
MRHARFWLWLALKLTVAALLVLGFWTVTTWVVPPPATGLLAQFPRMVASDWPYVLAVIAAIFLGFGLGWVCAADQVLRCRVCARRLKMPRSEGDLSHTLLGSTPPRTEYICTWGHGRLLVPETHLPTSRPNLWIGNRSLWEDLIQAERQARRRRS